MGKGLPSMGRSTHVRVVVLLAACAPSAPSNVCPALSPTLAVFVRLPWFDEGGAWVSVMRNQSAALGFECVFSRGGGGVAREPLFFD